MSEIKIYDISSGVVELQNSSYKLESELQHLIEKNMEVLFSVDFLATEYAFSGGRIDSLGIDENNCPVIFEYKRNMNENVINQGLFYLEWLLDHKADFELLVLNQFGKKRADEIEWSTPIVYCIANEFTKYDVNAVKQMQRNIQLVEYMKYENNLLVFDYLNLDLKINPIKENHISTTNKSTKYRTIEDRMESLNPELKTILKELRTFIISLSDEVSELILKQYIAYKKINNFVTVDMTNEKIQIYLSLNPDKIEIKDNMRDMRDIGHFGTGDVEILIRNEKELQQAVEYIENSFNQS